MPWYGMVWYGMVWYGMVWYGTWQVTRQSAQGPPVVARRTRKAKAADVDLETRRGVAEKLRATSPTPEQSGAAAARSSTAMRSSGGAAPQLFHTMPFCWSWRRLAALPGTEADQRTSTSSGSTTPEQCCSRIHGAAAPFVWKESYRILVWVFGVVARSSY